MPAKKTTTKKKQTSTKKAAKPKNGETAEILSVIEESYDGSSCQHGRGSACSVSHVSLKKSKHPHKDLGLTKKDLMQALTVMFKARYSDNKHLTLVKQGKSFFHIGGSGHEGVQTAIGLSFQHGVDWGWTYYRDIAYTYAMGLTTKEYFLLALGKPEDPAAGGRQMPGHYGHPKLNLPTQSSSTGTQYLNAVGEITYVASGEGTTSQGEFYEAVNWATREKLPVLFCVQDNGYAISVPKEKQSMGTSVGHSFCCYSNLKMKTFDGWDYFASVQAAREADEYIRSGKGPVLLHANVERLLPHSSSDDHRKYRPMEELEHAKNKSDKKHY